MERTQHRLRADELAPEPLAPPDAHPLGVCVSRRRPPVPLRGLAHALAQDARIDPGALVRELAGAPQRAEGRLVFEDERVVEVEEEGADHRGSLWSGLTCHGAPHDTCRAFLHWGGTRVTRTSGH